MWPQLKLKADEAAFFAAQLRVHSRYPHQFLFYLSAFLSSARAITFHLQKAFAHKDTTEVYKELLQSMLSDPVCRFFVKLRNHAEKEGYPPLNVEQCVGIRAEATGEVIWIVQGSANLFKEAEGDTEWLEKLIRVEWDLASMNNIPDRIQYRWSFANYPGDEADVVVACEDYMQRLWRFLATFRARWERENDPQARNVKFNKFLEL